MLIALILFIIMYVLLLTFSNQRWLVSLGFAALFIITGILPFFNALGAINWNVIMMLAGTMITVELFNEGFRLDDLKRWKTAETEMPMDLVGVKWKGTEYETEK